MPGGAPGNPGGRNPGGILHDHHQTISQVKSGTKSLTPWAACPAANLQGNQVAFPVVVLAYLVGNPEVDGHTP